jgi:hypothetical protein
MIMEEGMKANKSTTNKLLMIVTLVVLLYEPPVFSTVICGTDHSYSPVYPDNFPSSPNLCGQEGIMDLVYSIIDPGNPDADPVLKYQRKSDLNDQLWKLADPGGQPVVKARVIAKFGGFDVTLDIDEAGQGATISGDGFNNKYFSDLNNGYGTQLFSAEDIEIPYSAADFVFSLFSDVNQQTFYSDPSKNIIDDLFDHMVTFEVTGGREGTLVNELGLTHSYVIAWEDLLGGGDRDYNDLVVEVAFVQPVPEPSTILLIVSVFPGLFYFARKNRKLKN